MSDTSENSALLIAGPTASGKSALALDLAEKTGGVIINADAMQVYADLRILTARPGAEDEARIPHALYGHVGGATRYSAGKWLSDIGPQLKSVWARGVPAIITGGTGLYFKALEEGLSPVPDVSPAIRNEIAESLKQDGITALQGRLKTLDPEGAAALEPTDTQRIVRALEVVVQTGKPLSVWNAKPVTGLLDGARVSRGYVMCPREELYQRCNARFTQMIEMGALDEAQNLIAQGLDPALPVMKAIGVREFGAYLSGAQGLDEAVAAAQMQTRRYAKRQMTWFRGQMGGWPSGSADVLKGHFEDSLQ